MPPIPRSRGARSCEHGGGRLFAPQNDSDRGPSNFYYWYYATLALYQHGGEPWSKWNAKIRDRIVGLQPRLGPPDLEAGTPMVVCTGAKGAGSIAQLWRR